MSSTGNRTAAIAGFTLLELLIVMAIMALGMALVPAMFISGTDSQTLKADLRQIVSTLRLARSRAILLNTPVAVSIDTRERKIEFDGRDEIGRLHATSSLSLGVAATAWRSDHIGIIEFNPDGSSSGGEMQLANNAARYRVAIDWLTGNIVAIKE